MKAVRTRLRCLFLLRMSGLSHAETRDCNASGCVHYKDMTEEKIGARFAQHTAGSRVLGLCGRLLKKKGIIAIRIIINLGHARTMLPSLQ